jgi:hypothetical protein
MLQGFCYQYIAHTYNGIGRNVFLYNTVGTNDYIIANGNVFKYDHVRAYPAIVANGNSTNGKTLVAYVLWHVTETMVVIVKFNVLAKQAVIANGNVTSAINGNIVVEKSMVANTQVATLPYGNNAMLAKHNVVAKLHTIARLFDIEIKIATQPCVV